ncbi:hypothetical protein HY025_00250 [Candidatus Daviesbacteria bacterium]|nr:hypothetical protein [Candidatus Daviesbacteria bacterium]
MNVNNQQTFIVTKNQSNFFIQNPVFLSTKSINDFTFYSKFESQLLDLKNNLKDIGICGKETSDQLFNIELTNENSFKISSKNSQVCLKIPLKNLISKDKLTAFETLARLKFLIPSGSNLAGHYCIYDTSLNRCIKEEKNLSSQNIITSYFTLDSSLVDNLVLIFYADNFDNQLRFLSYQDIELSISSPSGSYSVFPQDLYKLLSNQTLNFNKNDQLKIDSNIQQLDLFKEGHFPNTCSDILPKFFDRKVNLSLRFIEYTSEGGSSCDSFSIPTLSHNLSYLLDLEVQNITGLPMRVCVSNNTTKRCDLYLDLKASNEFTHQILVLPPAEDGGFGFDIDFDNISIGNDSSVNRLRSLKIIPFPYYWISEMSFTDKNDYRVEQLAINNQKQILPGLYSLNLSKTSSKPSLLVFNQAFGKGWIAIFGQHVLVNSFANGWLIDSKLNRATELIFYLPNLLEVLGFIFLVFTFISLIWKLKKGAAN